MKLFDLDVIPWKQSQLIYHALGELDEESVVICTPKERYACVGFAQDISQELDLNYCIDNDIGFFRREIGGGTVFLDQNQLFYQMIINRDDAPFDQRVLFKKYLEPVIRTYKALGINAKYKPVSDLIVGGKKISGNGGGDIGKCKVMTGSILLDFDIETMCSILRLPSEKFRSDVCASMKKNLTTVNVELGEVPGIQEIKSLLISNCKDMFGSLEKGELDSNIIAKMDELDRKYSAEKWLYKKMKQRTFRSIKIIEGLYLIHLISNGVEMILRTRNEEIYDIEIYNEQPEDLKTRLAEGLIGTKIDERTIFNKINDILKQ
jgi:lipoate-protein ligase A